MHIHKFNDSCGKSIIYSDKPTMNESMFVVRRDGGSLRHWVISRRIPNTTGNFWNHWEIIEDTVTLCAAKKYIEQCKQFMCVQNALL